MNFIKKILTKKTEQNSVFNIKYNILALLNILIVSLNSLLSIKIFGLSYQADVYAIIVTINIALSLIPALIYEQFIYFYNDLKIKSTEDAKDFFLTITNLLIVFLIIFIFFLILFNAELIKLFANKFDNIRYNLAVEANLINLFAFFFVPLINFNTLFFNAEMKYSFPYIIKSIAPFFTLSAFIYMMVIKSENLLIIMYANLIGLVVSFFIQLLLLKKMSFLKFRFKLTHPLLKTFLKNSFSIRIGNNINNLIVQPLTTNILAALPEGSVALYNYSNRFISIIQSILVGPSASILQSKISKSFSQKDILNINRLTNEFLKKTCGFLIPSAIILVTLIPFIFEYIIQNDNIQYYDIKTIQFLSIFFAFWSIQKIFEAPYFVIMFSAKNSSFIIYNNIRNILIILITNFILVPIIGMYSLPISFILGTLHNNITSYLKSKKELNKL